MLWFVTCLPGYIRFLLATRHVKSCQVRRALRLVRTNKTTRYGQQHGFSAVHSWHEFTSLPITDYSDYQPAVERILNGEQNILTADPVEILQPTSGTSSTPKLIPHTRSSAREIQRALDAWLVDLIKQRPRLILGSQYWSISPSTEVPGQDKGMVRVGFLDDVEYFGRRRRWIVRNVMAVPSLVRGIADMEANQYVTLLFLLRARDLALISIWHPSFFTILLEKMRVEWTLLLNDLEKGGVDSRVNIPPTLRPLLESSLAPVPARAEELRQLHPEAPRSCRDIWPKLQIISCWREGNVESEISQLKTAFPEVLIQGKGLLATEGVVSIPVGPSQRHACVPTSHILEFQEDSGAVSPLWALKIGHCYRVILTTGAGLYRYQLQDRVAVTGFHGQVPCVRFLGRAGVVSDCVGEKLHIEHIDDIVRDVTRRYFRSSRFAMLVPSTDENSRRYNFIVESDDEKYPDMDAVETFLESELCRNYHYAHARSIGQLQPAAVTLVDLGARKRYRDFMISNGAIAGAIKFPSLCTVQGIETLLIGSRVKARGASRQRGGAME